MSIRVRAVAQLKARHGPGRIGVGPWISPDTELQPNLRDLMTLADRQLTDVYSARYHTLPLSFHNFVAENNWSAFLHEHIPRRPQRPLDMSMFREANV